MSIEGFEQELEPGEHDVESGLISSEVGGHEVFEGATGQDAIDQASNIRPDLIMMDVQLPGLNGDEVTVRLKSNRNTRNIPVIINTGWTTACNIEARVERARDAGAAEVLYKPLQFPMVRNVLRSYLMA